MVQSLWREHTVQIKLLEPLLGVTPKNPEIYKAWIDDKHRGEDEEAPPVSEEKSWTGFSQDENGLYILDYMIKGYFKEVASILPKTLGLKRRASEELLAEATIRRRVDSWLSVRPRRIYLGVKEPAGYIERPLRAKTLRGDRIALVRSDYIKAGTILDFSVLVLTDCPITMEIIRTWLSYGEFGKGLGQFRGGSYGQFKVLSIEEKR